jgi:hypothetical protein
MYQHSMGVVQRDYIERTIEEAAWAIVQMLQLVRTGDFDLAMIVVDRTRDLVLGPMRPVLERVDAATSVDLVGRFELDRLRMYAVLLGEEGAIHERRGKPAKAEQCHRHALELYAAISLAGARLQPADWERIALLEPKIEGDSIDRRYREELLRLAAQASASLDDGAGIVAT